MGQKCPKYYFRIFVEMPQCHGLNMAAIRGSSWLFFNTASGEEINIYMCTIIQFPFLCSISLKESALSNIFMLGGFQLVYHSLLWFVEFFCLKCEHCQLKSKGHYCVLFYSQNSKWHFCNTCRLSSSGLSKCKRSFHATDFSSNIMLSSSAYVFTIT